MTKDWASDCVIVADDGLVEINAGFANKSLFLFVIEDCDTLLEQGSVATLTDKVGTFNDVLFESKNPVRWQHVVFLFSPLFFDLCLVLLVVLAFSFCMFSIIPCLFFPDQLFILFIILSLCSLLSSSFQSFKFIAILGLARLIS